MDMVVPSLPHQFLSTGRRSSLALWLLELAEQSLRALRKKHNHILQLEASIAPEKSIPTDLQLHTLSELAAVISSSTSSAYSASTSSRPTSHRHPTTTTAYFRWPYRLKPPLRRRKPPTIRLGGKKKHRRGLLLGRLFRRARLRWLKLKYSCMINKLKQYYRSIVREMTEASGSIESVQQRILITDLCLAEMSLFFLPPSWAALAGVASVFPTPLGTITTPCSSTTAYGGPPNRNITVAFRFSSLFSAFSTLI
ncbi:hypothetical protein TEA_015494 [Camellia sinensis var. sinensis]|uniref:Uncharacterized protein n=1 Tax=Camellia sinensis var. sinensis TaxID=542762 RepID=A0A4S4DMD8_CAMSN|nr:hypothetical protein TEA_015494 [Camellia sinensis var. sinensis]